MKALIQRVSRANVCVDGQLVSEIGRGLCILVGISTKDDVKDVEYLSKKIVNLRLFENEEKKRWMESVKDQKLEILCVSQFTLYASTKKGQKPDFHKAALGEKAQSLYNLLLEKLGKDYDATKIKDGIFGAMMEVTIQNSGPVTIEIESPENNENVK